MKFLCSESDKHECMCSFFLCVLFLAYGLQTSGPSELALMTTLLLEVGLVVHL